METIHTGDVLEVLRTLDDECVDLVFADPPFNVGLAYAGDTTRDSRTDYPSWCASWIAECFRVLKTTGTFYLMTISRHLCHVYPQMNAHGVFINQVNWHNVASTGSKRSFWNEYQPILVYGKTQEYIFNTYAQRRKASKQRWGGYKTEEKGQMLDYWDDIPFVYAGSIKHDEAILLPGTNQKAHPAQMPIALPERAIMFSTLPGSVVLDPFCGSGTTGIAAMKHERDFIGIEISPAYVEIIEKRIRDFSASPSFFSEVDPSEHLRSRQGRFDE